MENSEENMDVNIGGIKGLKYDVHCKNIDSFSSVSVAQIKIIFEGS